jgi:hypothetical protein
MPRGGCGNRRVGIVEKRFSAKDEAFWRKRALPEEDHVHLGIAWKRGYRWFRSENVVCLEHYRMMATKPTPGTEGDYKSK